LKFERFQVPQVLNYECFLHMDGRLSLFQKKSLQNFFIKRIFGLMLYKTDFSVLKFKSLSTRLNISFAIGVVSQHFQKSINNSWVMKCNFNNVKNHISKHYYQSGVEFTSLNHYGTLKVK